jgi:leader peptidase (prepilin peptidase)/N-methyltransferase
MNGSNLMSEILALLFDVPRWVWLTLAFLYGAIIGSFLNVCIYRIPRGEEIIKTPSHCPACGERIPWYLNIPILSWFILRGRSACCDARLSFQYPLVELACAILTTYLFATLGLTFEFLSAWLFTCLLLILLVTDWQTMRLPDILTIPGAVLGLIFAFSNVRIDITNALLGVIVGAGGFLVVALLYRFTRGHEGMGMGDVKLMGMVGAFLGWQSTLLVVIIGSVIGLIAGGIIIARSPDGAKTRLPYGTFLGIAAIIVLLWGQPIIDWYVGLILGPEAALTG